MLGDQLGHLKHGNGALAAKNGLKVVIGIDVALVGGVLEAMLFNILPKLFNYLRARHWARANHGGELIAHLERLHKRGICHKFKLTIKKLAYFHLERIIPYMATKRQPINLQPTFLSPEGQAEAFK